MAYEHFCANQITGLKSHTKPLSGLKKKILKRSGCRSATYLGTSSPRTNSMNKTKAKEIAWLSRWSSHLSWSVRRSVTNGSVKEPIAIPTIVIPICVPAM